MGEHESAPADARGIERVIEKLRRRASAERREARRARAQYDDLARAIARASLLDDADALTALRALAREHLGSGRAHARPNRARPARTERAHARPTERSTR